MLSKVGERSDVVKNFSNEAKEKSHFSVISSVRLPQKSNLTERSIIGSGGSQTSRVLKKPTREEDLIVRKRSKKPKEDYASWMKNEFKEQ